MDGLLHGFSDRCWVLGGGGIGGKGDWTLVVHQESGVTGLGKAAVVYLISNSRLSQICFNLLKKKELKNKKKKRYKK